MNKRRQAIVTGRDRITRAGGGNFAGPPREGGFAHAAFPGAAFAAAQRKRRARVRAFGQPRPVVAGENHERASGQIQFAHRVEDAAHAPVEFLHPIAERRGGLATELVAGMNRRVNGGVRKIKEERMILLLANKFHSFIGVTLGEFGLILGRDLFDDFVVAHQREWRAFSFSELAVFLPHVIRVREAEVMIEPVARGEKIRVIAEMPLADDRRRVALLLEQFGDGVFLGADPGAAHRH